MERGALVVDLRLCTAEALAVVCGLLRDAPGSLRQVVLRDGLTTLGGDAAYRERAEAYRRRRECGALGSPQLRLLLAALVAFLAVRGGQLEALDLGGAHLGGELSLLLAPLARTLRSCRTRELRFLGLGGCRLGDRGLALLLPWFAGVGNSVPCLEALVLSWNCLADIRLVDALLRERANFCFERRAAPLKLLDLSGNARLGEPPPAGPSAVAPPPLCATRRGATPRGGGSHALRLSACSAPLVGRRSALVRVVACAISEGLPLKVLRLRRMGLDEQALQPLLLLMQAETKRCLASDGALAGASGFCLEKLELSGNQLEAVFVAGIEESLGLLRAIRERGAPELPGQVAEAVKGAPRSEQKVSPTHPKSDRRASGAAPPWLFRSRSEPCLLWTHRGGSGARAAETLAALVRDAVSDGDGFDDQGMHVGLLARNQRSGGSGSLHGHCSDREALLLRRALDRRRFRDSAVALACRRPRPRQPPEPLPGAMAKKELSCEEEDELTIAGALGPTAAHSMVRQAVLQELRSGASLRTTTSGKVTTTVVRGLEPPCVDAVQQPWEPLHHVAPKHAPTSTGVDEKRRGEEDTKEKDEQANVEEKKQIEEEEKEEKVEEEEDDEKQAEAHLLRAERLEALRGAVFAALTPTDCLQGTALTCNSFVNNQLDEMHREALGELRGRVAAQELLWRTEENDGASSHLTNPRIIG